MFSFLQIALITGLQTLQAHEVCPSWGLQTPGLGRRPAGGLARALRIAPGLAPRAAGQGCCREVSAKKEKHTVVNRGDPRARERACLRAAPGPREDPGKGTAERGDASSNNFCLPPGVKIVFILMSSASS